MSYENIMSLGIENCKIQKCMTVRRVLSLMIQLKEIGSLTYETVVYQGYFSQSIPR